jgi:hypothetical protein
MEMYPDNKTSSFKVNLPNALDLDSTKWEVGLSEIQFLHMWYNIRKGKNAIVKDILNPTDSELNILHPVDALFSFQFSHQTEIVIPEGYYSNVQEVLTKLQEHEDNQVRSLKFEYNQLDQKSRITLPKDCTLDMNKSDIAKCLGFNQERILDMSATSDTIATTNHMYHSVYVYTDIIANQSVGNYKVPLLRVIPITSSHGNVSCVKYDKPHFLPLSRSRVQTIEINLRDDTGEFISFEAGKAIVTLVFRRKVSKFFN